MTSDERYEICQSCDWFRTVIKQCKKCGCIMPLKTQLQSAKCPIRKW